MRAIQPPFFPHVHLSVGQRRPRSRPSSLLEKHPQAGLPEQSYLHADSLWREVIGLTLADQHVKEAVAKGAMPSASGDRTTVSDREMEASING